MRFPRTLRTVAVGIAAVGLSVGPLPWAAAEGPGYGGDAGQLAVSWEEAPVAATVPAEVPPDQPADQPAEAPAPEAPAPEAPPAEAPADQPLAAASVGGAGRGVSAGVRVPAADPQLQNDALALMVRGLGFRSKSEIEVRIGSDLPVVTRADGAGALAVSLDPAKLGGAQPGVSVMAVGRNQSGTQVTLFGSIPPVADGSGPMSIVPWAAASITVAGLALWMRRRHAAHRDDADDAPAAV